MDVGVCRKLFVPVYGLCVAHKADEKQSQQKDFLFHFVYH